jgi:hypothetical protein
VAQVAFQTGDQEYTTVVNLPDADTAQAAPTEPSRPSGAGGIAGLVSLVVAGLVLIVLAVLTLVPRTRRRASVDSSPPVVAPGPQAGTPPAPALAMPATQKEAGGPSSDSPPSSTMATSPPQRQSRRGSLTAAVQGRRSARLALDAQPEREARRGPPQNQPQRPSTPDDNQPKPRAPDRVFRRGDTSTESPVVRLLSRFGSRIAARVARDERLAEEGGNAGIVLTGSGNAVVNLTKNAPSPAVVRITGNPASRYFGVRAVGAEDDLVNTLHPYHGVRPLDWNGTQSTGFEVKAIGPWTIEVLPLSATPKFSTSFKGEGDMVVRFTGNGSLAEITGNNESRYFKVRATGPNGTDDLVKTTRPYAGSCQISRGPQFFEVRAVGPWTITVK